MLSSSLIPGIGGLRGRMSKKDNQISKEKDNSILLKNNRISLGRRSVHRKSPESSFHISKKNFTPSNLNAESFLRDLSKIQSGTGLIL